MRRIPETRRPVPVTVHVPVAVVMPGVAMVLVAAMRGMLATALVHMPEALMRPWSMVHPRTMDAEAARAVTPAARRNLAANSEAGTADNQYPDERSRKHGASPGILFCRSSGILAERQPYSAPLDGTV